MDLEELTYEDLADTVDIEVDWDQARAVLGQRPRVGDHHVKAVFKALERTEIEYPTRDELYAEIEDEFAMTSAAFKEGLNTLTRAGIIPSDTEEKETLYHADVYRKNEWRTIEGKVHRLDYTDF